MMEIARVADFANMEEMLCTCTHFQLSDVEVPTRVQQGDPLPCRGFHEQLFTCTGPQFMHSRIPCRSSIAMKGSTDTPVFSVPNNIQEACSMLGCRHRAYWSVFNIDHIVPQLRMFVKILHQRYLDCTCDIQACLQEYSHIVSPMRQPILQFMAKS